MRNDFQFNNNVLNEQRVTITSIYFAKDITKAFNSGNIVTNINDERLIKWYFPLSGCIKINMDRSNSADDCRGNFGGIIRSCQ